MKKLGSIIAKVLEIDEKSITDNTEIANVEAWDSFNGLMLFSEVEDEFGIKFTIDEIGSVKRVRDIKNMLKKKGVLDESR